MRKLASYLVGIYYSPRHLLLHILFLLAICFLYLERDHENALYYNIIRATKANYKVAAPDTVYIRKLMQTIHTMMYNRLAVFNNTEQLSLKNRLFHSVDEDLMYGHGACGGFSKVLSRSLQLSGYKVRIGQMKVDGVFGGHIFVEVFLEEVDRWAVIDPLYLLTFPGSDGAWAGFEEVKNNWSQYSRLVPVDYKQSYRYGDVRYANWGKIPLVGPLIYKSLALIIGKEKAQNISVRPYLLNMYAVWLYLTITLYILFCIFSYNRFKRQSRKRAYAE